MTVQFHHNGVPSATFAVWMYLVPDGTIHCPVLLGRDSWMRFHSRSYQMSPSTPDGRILVGVIPSHICDNPGAASDVAYHLIRESEGVSLDTTPQLTPVNLVCLDGSPALTGHYMVDLLPLSDSSQATECFLSLGRQNNLLSGCRERKPVDILGTASSPLLRVPLESLNIIDSPNEVSTIAKPDTPDTASTRNPTPETIRRTLPHSQRSAR